jgi:hypothetical protein
MRELPLSIQKLHICSVSSFFTTIAPEPPHR